MMTAAGFVSKSSLLQSVQDVNEVKMARPKVQVADAGVQGQVLTDQWVVQAVLAWACPLVRS